MKKNIFLSHSETGFSMMEVLVTLLVTSIGLLGVMAMQLTAIRNTHEAGIHSQAIIYTNDMVERILANTAIAINNGYTIAHGAKPSSASDCVASECTTAALADYDITEWQNALSDSLPSGAGQIETAASTVTVTVRWDDDRDGDTGQHCPTVNESDLDCVKVSVKL